MAWITRISDKGWELLNQAVSGNQLIFEGITLHGYVTDSAGNKSAYLVSPDTFSVVRENGYTIIKTEISNTEIRNKANNFAPLLAYLDNPIEFFDGQIQASLQNQEDSGGIFATIFPENESGYIYLPPTSSGTSTAKFTIPLALSNSENIQITTEDSIHVTQSQLDAAVATAPVCYGDVTFTIAPENWTEYPISGGGSFFSATFNCPDNGTRYPMSGIYGLCDPMRYFLQKIHPVATGFPTGTMDSASRTAAGPLRMTVYAAEQPADTVDGTMLIFAKR